MKERRDLKENIVECSNCGGHGTYYVNAIRCPHCDEMYVFDPTSCEWYQVTPESVNQPEVLDIVEVDAELDAMWRIMSQEQQEHVISYFSGKTFGRQDIYEVVDWLLYGQRTHEKYDFDPNINPQPAQTEQEHDTKEALAPFTPEVYELVPQEEIDDLIGKLYDLKTDKGIENQCPDCGQNMTYDESVTCKCGAIWVWDETEGKWDYATTRLPVEEPTPKADKQLKTAFMYISNLMASYNDQNKAIEDIVSRIEHLERSNDTMETTIDGVHDDVNNKIQQLTDKVEKNYGIHGLTIDNMQEELKSLQLDVNDLRTQLNDLKRGGQNE